MSDEPMMQIHDSDGRELGRLVEGEDGKLTFTGDTDLAAQVFLDVIVEEHSKVLRAQQLMERQLRSRIKFLERESMINFQSASYWCMGVGWMYGQLAEKEIEGRKVADLNFSDLVEEMHDTLAADNSNSVPERVSTRILNLTRIAQLADRFYVYPDDQDTRNELGIELERYRAGQG